MTGPLAYYNEIDPVAAKWLRNLIAAGHIAPGYVDERSIEDVKPADLRGFTQCHFFAGIGIWSLALRRAGWPDSLPVWTASCPCQPFSASGKSAAFDDERHLWPSLAWLLEQCRPTVAIGEQVASKAADDWVDLVQADLEAMGYAFGAVAFPSAGVGAPHIRDRAYWVAHADNQCEEPSAERARLADACRGGHALEFVDHADDSRLQRHAGDDSEAGREGSGRPITTASLFGRMDDAHGWYTSAEREQSSGQHGLVAQDSRGGSVVGLADADCDGREPGSVPVRQRQQGQSETVEPGRGEAGDMADTGLLERSIAEPERCDTGLSGGREQGASSPAGCGGADGAGPVNGHWANADWLFCRDGKWRPVEPGSFPLAHGIAGRVGRLRAYGNAINLEAAVAFISTIDHPRSGRYVRHASQHHA